jgi:hypothetical protein
MAELMSMPLKKIDALAWKESLLCMLHVEVMNP